MGVSGVGKIILMDVLVGWKIGGYIQGDISIFGYFKNQEIFVCIVGYCEQVDIYLLCVIVYELFVYFVWFWLLSDVDLVICMVRYWVIFCSFYCRKGKIFLGL